MDIFKMIRWSLITQPSLQLTHTDHKHCCVSASRSKMLIYNKKIYTGQKTRMGVRKWTIVDRLIQTIPVRVRSGRDAVTCCDMNSNTSSAETLEHDCSGENQKPTLAQTVSGEDQTHWWTMEKKKKSEGWQMHKTFHLTESWNPDTKPPPEDQREAVRRRGDEEQKHHLMITPK